MGDLKKLPLFDTSCCNDSDSAGMVLRKDDPSECISPRIPQTGIFHYRDPFPFNHWYDNGLSSDMESGKPESGGCAEI